MAPYAVQEEKAGRRTGDERLLVLKPFSAGRCNMMAQAFPDLPDSKCLITDLSVEPDGTLFLKLNVHKQRRFFRVKPGETFKPYEYRGYEHVAYALCAIGDDGEYLLVPR